MYKEIANLAKPLNVNMSEFINKSILKVRSPKQGFALVFGVVFSREGGDNK
jgi:hypothetical protein